MAIAICNASRGVTAEATARIDAIEVSNCILIDYTDSIYRSLPPSSPLATSASKSAVTSQLALLIYHRPVTLMPLAHAAQTALSNVCRKSGDERYAEHQLQREYLHTFTRLQCYSHSY